MGETVVRNGACGLLNLPRTTTTSVVATFRDPLPPPERHKSEPVERAFAAPVLLPNRPPIVKQAGARRSVSKARVQSRAHVTLTPAKVVSILHANGSFALKGLSQASPVTQRQIRRQAKLVRRTLRLLHPEFSADMGAISRLIWEAHASADDEYGESEAIAWAEQFQFPEDIHVRDSNGLRMAHGNLATYVRARHETMAATGRLSRDSIEAWVPLDDPDRDRLLDLVDGIPIVVDEAFQPNLAPPPLREKYIRVSPAVNRLMYDLWSNGLVFIIPTAEAILIPGIHFSQTHWAPKKGKKCGRPIGDASAKEAGGFALNSDEVKALVETKWGRIYHPTLQSLADMVKRAHVDLDTSATVLWKIDLKGAFTLLFVDPDSCQRLAFALTDDLTMLYHVGMFGWTGMPAAFQVVTRVISRVVNAQIRGEAEMYVDDLMGCCALTDLVHDLGVARAVCNGLLGVNAVEEKKTLHGRSLDFIGWVFDLDLQSVSVARHNYLKTLNGFMSVDVRAPVSVKEVQRMASWASRYSAVCRTLKPFTQDLFDSIRGRHSHAVFQLPAHAIRAVEVWRGTLLSLQLDPAVFSRPIHTLGTRHAEYLIEYDACLSGVGLILSALDSMDRRSLICAAKLSLLDFHFGEDSSYQNVSEFIAVVSGLAMLAGLGIHGAGIRIIGDNTSSLSWCVHQRFHSDIGKATATMYMAIATICDLQIVEGVHIPGDLNEIPDSLSRDGELADWGYSGSACFVNSDYPAVTAAVSICDPRLAFGDSDDLFYSFWGRTFTIANQLAAAPLDPRVVRAHESLRTR